MTQPTNILQQVQTYQRSGLAFLLNEYGITANTNSKFKNFQDFEGNLGSTVTFDLPPRMRTVQSLVAQFEAAVQRVETLTVDKELSSSFAFTAQQMIYNVDPDNYLPEFAKSAIYELGSEIEQDLAQQFIDSTYRFYGDGVTPINTFNQLAQAVAFLREYGSARGPAKGFLPNLAIPNIIGSGLNQFATERNNDIAYSWDLGDFSDATWIRSNLLKTHTAGTEGNEGTTLTVVSTTVNAANQITAITFSGTSAASDANSVKSGDKFQFQDNVSGQTNMRYLTFTGYNVSGCPVQFRATADAQSTSGSQVTVTINPPLQAAYGKDQNINAAVQAGMQVKVLPTHKAGCLWAGNPFYMGMPMLPDQTPYPTHSESDPETGVAIRAYWGTVFAQNQQGFVYDAIWGKKLVGEYCIELVFPA